MTVCKVSYVVKGSKHPGGIINLDHIPVVGEKLSVGDTVLKVSEVVELMPPRGEFVYIHATCFIEDS
jgi:hypothetical protein